ncbi:UDP-glucose 4-epimerase GalE [Crocosphaera sp. UHCC 0190]|uniref:UDP-glucose 4-epimerase GalE n=1 Tax=Crocosphaera sp. UHCC 0190 TaxID=3110246 RepID=UPI002B217374|nr:UDP-glucose 4-epimerase GalE [Crocosphaera sp. UHCC 0190]MEA5511020.1 UDP-glucose 4-epimerase GalE [Crocosphaera sp. UHCC 0190]
MLNVTKILVTGGAGYLGSHTVQQLTHYGYEVIILDNLSNGHEDIVKNVLKVPLIKGDIRDSKLLEQILRDHSIDAVIHFAADAYVGESTENPAKYYNNNVGGTLTILEAMKKSEVDKFVFSSTCATYGIPQELPINESHPQNPINPYGASKKMVEQILADFDRAYGLKYVCFRFFNAAGADPNGELGEDHQPEPHLIPLVFYTALGKRSSISIFGSDYPTQDGTCVRDYIHVLDLAQAHLLGLKYLLNGGESEIFNLGNGEGFSVKEVIDIAREVTGKTIKVEKSDRRAGDPAILVSSSQKASQILGWQPQYPNLKTIMTHAWQWHLKRHGDLTGR